MRTITAFPALFDDLDALTAYELMQGTLAPYPELRERFFERFDPLFEARLETALYGPPRRERWYRLRSVWRLFRPKREPALGSSVTVR